VGHYFDDTQPTLRETVASLNGVPLVHPPGTRTKYSNAGIALLGEVLARAGGGAFEDVVRREALAPLGLQGASFRRADVDARRFAVGEMWGYDGRSFAAPTFELGMSPAGSLDASMLDLARFLVAVFRGGDGVLRPETLAEMLTPAERGAFGIGFHVGALDGRRSCGHGGAVYGFATQLSFLPDEQLGVAVSTTVDGANRTVERIADHALRALLAARDGAPPPRIALTEPLAQGRAMELAGLYGSGADEVRLCARGDRLYIEAGALRSEVRAIDGALVVDDRHAFGRTLAAAPGGALVLDGRLYQPLAEDAPPPAPPPRWRDLVGEYGWDHNVLFVLERRGRLYALVEWFWFDELTELEPDVFALPTERGLYAGERVVFERGPDGSVQRAVLAGIAFGQRTPGAADGETFRIEPEYGADELRARARAASPPRAGGDLLPADLVELADVDPTLQLDIRYATTNNFMSTVFYPEARAFLQRPAAAALARVHARLRERGYGLRVFDAYRPWHVTKMFWDATPAAQKIFVADPSQGSRHNRGCAVDLTLVHAHTGAPVEMVAGYDEFSERSFPDYPGGTSRQRWHRELLRSAMLREGFHTYEWEWWHFDFAGWERYPILDLEFAQLDVRR
jgi:D-alanyl-D-alanine dipeptidase/CubicO group peptidase (beta-lactamase class C family)